MILGSWPVRDGICVDPPLCRGTSQGKYGSRIIDLVCAGETVGKMGEVDEICERELVLVVSVRCGKEWVMTRGWQLFWDTKMCNPEPCSPWATRVRGMKCGQSVQHVFEWVFCSHLVCLCLMPLDDGSLLVHVSHRWSANVMRTFSCWGLFVILTWSLASCPTNSRISIKLVPSYTEGHHGWHLWHVGECGSAFELNKPCYQARVRALLSTPCRMKTSSDHVANDDIGRRLANLPRELCHSWQRLHRCRSTPCSWEAGALTAKDMRPLTRRLALQRPRHGSHLASCSERVCTHWLSGVDASWGRMLCFVFVLTWKKRRRRRGFVTTKKPHQHWWGFFDYEGTSMQFNNTFYMRARVHAMKKVNALKILSLEAPWKGGTRLLSTFWTIHQNREAYKQNEGKPSFRRRQKMFKTVPSQRAGFTLKERTWASERLLHLSWHSEHKERGESRDSELTPTRVPHFLAQKKHWQMATECHPPDLPILQENRDHFTCPILLNDFNGEVVGIVFVILKLINQLICIETPMVFPTNQVLNFFFLHPGEGGGGSKKNHQNPVSFKNHWFFNEN